MEYREATGVEELMDLMSVMRAELDPDDPRSSAWIIERSLELARESLAKAGSVDDHEVWFVVRMAMRQAKEAIKVVCDNVDRMMDELPGTTAPAPTGGMTTKTPPPR